MKKTTTPSLTKIREDIYKIPFEIMQLEKELNEKLLIVKSLRKRLNKLRQKV